MTVDDILITLKNILMVMQKIMTASPPQQESPVLASGEFRSLCAGWKTGSPQGWKIIISIINVYKKIYFKSGSSLQI